MSRLRTLLRHVAEATRDACGERVYSAETALGHETGIGPIDLDALVQQTLDAHPTEPEPEYAVIVHERSDNTTGVWLVRREDATKDILTTIMDGFDGIDTDVQREIAEHVIAGRDEEAIVAWSWRFLETFEVYDVELPEPSRVSPVAQARDCIEWLDEAAEKESKT